MRLKIIKGPSFEQIRNALFNKGAADRLSFTVEPEKRQRKKLNLPSDQTDITMDVFVTEFGWVVREKSCDLGVQIDSGLLFQTTCQVEHYQPLNQSDLGTMICHPF